MLHVFDRRDDTRQQHRLTVIPLAACYLSPRRELHIRAVLGPAVIAGWAKYIQSDVDMLGPPLLTRGASGSLIYSTGPIEQVVLLYPATALASLGQPWVGPIVVTSAVVEWHHPLQVSPRAL